MLPAWRAENRQRRTWKEFKIVKNARPAVVSADHRRNSSEEDLLPESTSADLRGGPPIAEALFAHVLRQFSIDPSLTAAESAEEKATYAPLGCGA